MPLHFLDYSRIPLWSATDLAYIGQDPRLRPFYAHAPTREGLAEALAVRRAHVTDRDLLYEVLAGQYQSAGILLPDTAARLRSPNTFTVTTAHQPSVLTGPLYNIYKIASTIQLARQLSAGHPGTDVLPVFVVGGEDHDWAEINHLHLFGKRYTWEREASGACGRLSVEGLDAFIDEIFTLLERNPFAPSAHAQFKACLDGVRNYGGFHQKLIASLFGRFGLLVLNMDDPRLKRAFIPWMERELTESFSMRTVPPVQQDLERSGFKPQAFCRPVNLFYMRPGSRERIDHDGDGFALVESGTGHTRQAMIDLLHAHPEDFSPNVILRPLYQEQILPNIAFVGGGGEIAYWLERKSQFAEAGIPYPVLVRRNSLMLLDEAAQQQLSKAGLTWADILDDYDTVVKRYLLRHSETDLTFDTELAALTGAFAALAAKAERIDPTLAKAIAAEQIKQAKAFEQLGSRLLRAEKHQQEAQLHRIQKVRERLFPNNGLQERHENFLPFYTQYGPEWLEKLIPMCDPLDGRFRLLELPL